MGCNHCFALARRKRAEKDGETFELRGKPLDGFPLGVDVYVGGTWLAWLAEVPETCANLQHEGPR